MNDVETLIDISFSCFFCNDMEKARVSKYSTHPPYKLFKANESWYGVFNNQDVNCLSFGNGAVFTSKENAEALVAKWNTKDQNEASPRH